MFRKLLDEAQAGDSILTGKFLQQQSGQIPLQQLIGKKRCPVVISHHGRVGGVIFTSGSVQHILNAEIRLRQHLRGSVRFMNQIVAVSHKEPLPDVMTPHTMRHTFCTRMANAGMNPKALQYIMGHANIVMTLNYYAHATFHSAQEEMERLQAKAKPTTEAKPEAVAESAEETRYSCRSHQKHAAGDGSARRQVLL